MQPEILMCEFISDKSEEFFLFSLLSKVMLYFRSF